MNISPVPIQDIPAVPVDWIATLVWLGLIVFAVAALIYRENNRKK